MITIYDIAKKANVSAMTVSRVINNTGRISEATRRRVREVMDKLGYVPNSVARGLVKQETKILSLLITDITNPFFTTLARGAEDAAKACGYRLLLANSDESLDKEKEYVDMVLSTRADGVLFAPAGDDSLEHLRKLRRHNIPFVLIDRRVPGIECDAVLGDSRGGTVGLMDYLIDLGHRRIALLNGARSVSTARERAAGYAEALARHGIPFDPELVMEASYRRLGDAEADATVERLLSLAEPPTAILAANNFLAIDVIRALRARGLSVPDDVSVVCFDDLELASALHPFLTVAAQPAYEFGRRGIELLVGRIRGTAGTNGAGLASETCGSGGTGDAGSADERHESASAGEPVVACLTDRVNGSRDPDEPGPAGVAGAPADGDGPGESATAGTVRTARAADVRAANARERSAEAAGPWRTMVLPPQIVIRQSAKPPSTRR